jgi:hypothetical protein
MSPRLASGVRMELAVAADGRSPAGAVRRFAQRRTHCCRPTAAVNYLVALLKLCRVSGTRGAELVCLTPALAA